MDKKIKLLVVTSVVAVMATGCSRFSRTGGGAVDGSDGYTETGASSSQLVGSSQVGGSSRGGLFSQQRSNTCAPCATTNNTQQAQTTAPAPAPAQTQAPRVYKPAAPKPYVQQGQHSQQWYIERWKRQQQQQQAQQRAQPQQNTNYNTGSNATYYDYSSAGRTDNVANDTNVSTSNKSIYTGSYQQKTYKPYNPTTYSGGSAATTNTGTSNTNTTYVSSSTNTSSGGNNTYIVKKGDTVFEIMRQTGVYWKDIIKLNNLEAPAYNINPGQVIRLK